MAAREERSAALRRSRSLSLTASLGMARLSAGTSALLRLWAPRPALALLVPPQPGARRQPQVLRTAGPPPVCPARAGPQRLSPPALGALAAAAAPAGRAGAQIDWQYWRCPIPRRPCAKGC